MVRGWNVSVPVKDQGPSMNSLSADDRWRQYVLNHVVYNINAKPVEDHYECKFSDPIAGIDR